MRRRIAALMLVSIAACARGTDVPVTPQRSVPSSPTATPEPTPDLSAFLTYRAMRHVRELGVEIGKREAGTETDAKGAAYIAGRIERLGWDVRQERFPLPQGGESTNVIGTPPGFNFERPYLLIGAHRDSINGPGANDNATGVAVALEVARAIDARPAALPVVFIAFGAEERQPAPGRPSRVGSRYHVDEMSERARRNLRALLNIDMVGHGQVHCMRTREGPSEAADRCARVADEEHIAAEERVHGDVSDHGPFVDAGMNATWLWTGDNPCCWHNARDTIDTVRPVDVKSAGRLALAILRSYR